MLTYLRAFIGRYIKNEKGQGAVEYALIIALVSIVIVALLVGMKDGFKTIVDTINSKLGVTP